MESILAAKNRPILSAFACSRVLLGFDFDGTLAPIVSNPSRARMRPSTCRLLDLVARCYPCVVISGRARADVTRRLGGARVWHVIGNHGLEAWAERQDAVLLVRDWLCHLRQHLVGYPGLVIEDKMYSVTVHYRDVRDKARVRKAIESVVHGLRNVRMLGGKDACNLLLRDCANKGATLQRLRTVLARDTAIYVGDDQTDEDAFQSGPRDQLLAIRVGRVRTSHAHYVLKSQEDIDKLLQVLLLLRRH